MQMVNGLVIINFLTFLEILLHYFNNTRILNSFIDGYKKTTRAAVRIISEDCDFIIINDNIWLYGPILCVRYI